MRMPQWAPRCSSLTPMLLNFSKGACSSSEVIHHACVVLLKLAIASICVFHTARPACIKEIARIMASTGDKGFRLSKWILDFQLAQKQERCSRSSAPASRATRMVDLAQPRQQQVMPRPGHTAQIPESIPMCGKCKSFGNSLTQSEFCMMCVPKFFIRDFILQVPPSLWQRLVLAPLWSAYPPGATPQFTRRPWPWWHPLREWLCPALVLNRTVSCLVLCRSLMWSHFLAHLCPFILCIDVSTCLHTQGEEVNTALAECPEESMKDESMNLGDSAGRSPSGGHVADTQQIVQADYSPRGSPKGLSVKLFASCVKIFCFHACLNNFDCNYP